MHTRGQSRKYFLSHREGWLSQPPTSATTHSRVWGMMAQHSSETRAAPAEAGRDSHTEAPQPPVSHRGKDYCPPRNLRAPATRHLLPPELRPSFLPREGPSCFSNAAINCEWTSGNSATEGTKLALHHALLFVNCNKTHFGGWTFPHVEDQAVCASSCGCPLEKPLTLPQPHPPGPHPQDTPPLHLCVYRQPTDPPHS